MDNCSAYKPKAYLQGQFLGYSAWHGSVIDSFHPIVDKCYEKYATISETPIPEPNVVFQLGESHTQTLQPIVAVQPEWAHLVTPRMLFANDDLAALDMTTF